MLQDFFQKKFGCVFLCGLGFFLLVVGEAAIIPMWLRISLGSITILITLAVGSVPFTNNRGEVSYVTGEGDDDDDDDDDEDIELKGEILNRLFPGVPVDEESNNTTALDKKDDEAGEEEAENDTTGCAICLEPFVSGDLIVSGVSCSHEFHRPCIMQWLMKKKKRLRGNTNNKHNTCPTCRSPMWKQEEYEKIEKAAIASRSNDETDNSNDNNDNGAAAAASEVGGE